MAKEPKELDRTEEDIKQDAKIAQEEKRSEALAGKSTDLERRVAQLENDVRVLAPLAELLGSITQIRRHFGVV